MATAAPLPIGAGEAARDADAQRRSLRLRGAQVAIGLTLLGAVLRLWAASLPGGHVVGWAAGTAVLGLAGLVWLTAIVLVAGDRVRRRPTVAVGWLLVPVVVVATLGGLLVGDVAFQARWTHSRAAFEEVLGRAEPDVPRQQTRDLDVEGRLGTYQVRRSRRRPSSGAGPRSMPAGGSSAAGRPDGSRAARRSRFAVTSSSFRASTATRRASRRSRRARRSSVMPVS